MSAASLGHSHAWLLIEESRPARRAHRTSSFVSQGVVQGYMSELNVRIAPEMAAFLERVARQTGRTKSEVVRDALEALRASGAWRAASPPAAAMAGLIGCWDSSGARLSERTGERFARLLQEGKHAQRTGRRRPARRIN